MEKYQEASIQIASSDVLLLTKGDISDNTTLENLIVYANDINPTAPIREIVDGCIDPDELFNIDINPNRQAQANIVRNGEKVGSAHNHIESVSITHDGTIPEEKLNYWLSDVILSSTTEFSKDEGSNMVGGQSGTFTFASCR